VKKSTSGVMMTYGREVGRSHLNNTASTTYYIHLDSNKGETEAKADVCHFFDADDLDA